MSTSEEYGAMKRVRTSVFGRLLKAFKFLNFRKSLATGLLSGGVAQFVASPADLVKVQMQMEGLRKLQNLPPRLA